MEQLQASALAEEDREEEEGLSATRFRSLISVNADGCWIWQGSFHSNGYGRSFRYKGEQWAHRVAYLLYKGPILTQNVIHHMCDNPSCCNPDHLEQISQAENIKNAILKGRMVPPRGRHVKISLQQVAQIKSLVSDGRKTISDIAREFSISRRQVNRIAAGYRNEEGF